jgi:DNA-nicking Smr family endonuclease
MIRQAMNGDPDDRAPPPSSASVLGDDAVPVVPIEDSIDLHGFQPRDIPSVVEEYVRAAAEQGFREVRLIHGRGIGFQRQRVREVLAQCAEVERFADAPATRGGWGATLAWLRPAPITQLLR